MGIPTDVSVAFLKDLFKFYHRMLDDHSSLGARTILQSIDMNYRGRGPTPLMYAIRHKDNPNVVELLLELGANVNRTSASLAFMQQRTDVTLRPR